MGAGQTGELCVRGYSVMRGYWADEARSAEVIRDGWMHTGDLAVIDAQGYCNIAGRARDMLIRGGENVYPREVEEFLYRHPAMQSPGLGEDRMIRRETRCQNESRVRSSDA